MAKEPVIETNVVAAPECGHLNRHYQGTEPMTCTLAPGHEGNHSAPYVRTQVNTVTNNLTQVSTTTKTDVPALSSWNDDAGIPLDLVEEMLADTEEQKRKVKPKSLLERMGLNSRKDAEDAFKRYIANAKAEGRVIENGTNS